MENATLRPATSRRPLTVTLTYLSPVAAALGATLARRARLTRTKYYPPNAAPFTPSAVRLTRAPNGAYGYVLTVTATRTVTRRGR